MDLTLLVTSAHLSMEIILYLRGNPNKKTFPFKDTAADQEVGYKKNTRTQVYSGRRNIFLSSEKFVPFNVHACVRRYLDKYVYDRSFHFS